GDKGLDDQAKDQSGNITDGVKRDIVYLLDGEQDESGIAGELVDGEEFGFKITSFYELRANQVGKDVGNDEKIETWSVGETLVKYFCDYKAIFNGDN
ncbi:MAG: hypothetical protein EZS28_044843, partial [Streblomastix strix]